MVGLVRGNLLRVILAFAALVFGASASAQQQTRVALIIANSAYVQQNPLANPARDAEAVRAALTRAGFQASVSANRTNAQMRADLLAFRRRADTADVALVYFAGHGMRVGQTNWLLPTDFDAGSIASDEDFEARAISHRTILRELGRAPTRIAVFDACRDNPYEATIAARMSLAARSATVSGTRNPAAPQPGLVAVEADDILVLFSAGAGQFALDGPQGQLSPFARAFVASVTTQTELRVMAGKIRDTVVASTGGERSRTAQRPYLSGSLGGREVYLMGAPLRTAPIGEEAAAFNRCNTQQTAACWRDYVARYPNGNNISTAKIVLTSLERPANPVGASDLNAVDATRRALAAMTPAEWRRGDSGVLATRLIATHGRASLERAAQLGDARAQWVVSRGFGEQLGGFPYDAAASFRWAQASAADGFAPGQSTLGALYYRGRGVQRDEREALRLLRLAVAQDDAVGQSNLGVLYLNGVDGLPKDEREAVRLFRLAADKGNASAQANLGLRYAIGGGGTPRDDHEAVRLFRQACGSRRALRASQSRRDVRSRTWRIGGQ